jgi:hypothetical protein
MKSPLPRRAAANPTQCHIEAIAKLELDALDRRTPTERVSDAITKLVGNVGFLLVQLLLIWPGSETCRKFVVSKPGAAYYAQARGPNRNST